MAADAREPEARVDAAVRAQAGDAGVRTCRCGSRIPNASHLRRAPLPCSSHAPTSHTCRRRAENGRPRRHRSQGAGCPPGSRQSTNASAGSFGGLLSSRRVEPQTKTRPFASIDTPAGSGSTFWAKCPVAATWPPRSSHAPKTPAARPSTPRPMTTSSPSSGDRATRSAVVTLPSALLASQRPPVPKAGSGLHVAPSRTRRRTEARPWTSRPAETIPGKTNEQPVPNAADGTDAQAQTRRAAGGEAVPKQPDGSGLTLLVDRELRVRDRWLPADPRPVGETPHRSRSDDDGLVEQPAHGALVCSDARTGAELDLPRDAPLGDGRRAGRRPGLQRHEGQHLTAPPLHRAENRDPIIPRRGASEREGSVGRGAEEHGPGSCRPADRHVGTTPPAACRRRAA